MCDETSRTVDSVGLAEFLAGAVAEIDDHLLAREPPRLVVLKQQIQSSKPRLREWFWLTVRSIPCDEWEVIARGAVATEIIDDQGIRIYNVQKVTQDEDSTTVEFAERTRLRFRGPSLSFSVAPLRSDAGHEIVRRWLCFESRHFVPRKE